ncbi:hypothetical protein GCM10012282_75700 [Streptomyces lacrimifluminis]|uniref:Uncharacterized protein n=1 Tax=Streptomyces lacrimifluminis TaxID=1500077 RepID=A0A917UM52_9ACTN|nr:hypothetical protein GCM10012282_75700 [Streptomyces lacrimifluminis]
MLDRHGLRVEPVAMHFKDLLAADTPATTLRSCGNDLLRWWRFHLCPLRVWVPAASL